MGATNHTTNYELPIFVGTDKPAWLVDWNGAMSDIDAAIKEAKTAADNAQTTANTATNNIATLDSSVSTIASTVASQSTAIAGNTGSINTINSLIGNGEPTTQDKTIIGAINEIAAEIPSVTTPTAAQVSYDGTTSGLTADDVQDAIDEVVSMIPSVTTPTAAQVSYDGTTSGLTADDVQDAIDELAGMIPSAGGTTYSTNEVDTGDVWIDGRHIFRKVVTGKTNSGTQAGSIYRSITSLDSVTADKIIKVYGNVTEPTAANYMIGGCSTSTGGSFASTTDVHVDQETQHPIFTISSTASSYVSNLDFEIVLEYVKLVTP